jgi:hypothetical protein
MNRSLGTVAGHSNQLSDSTISSRGFLIDEKSIRKRAKRLVQQKLFNATHNGGDLTTSRQPCMLNRPLNRLQFLKNLFRIRDGPSLVIHMAAATGEPKHGVRDDLLAILEAIDGHSRTLPTTLSQRAP